MARIDDIMDKHSIALDRLTEKQAVQVLSSYRKSAKELARDLAMGGGTDGKKQRRRVMLAQVKAGVTQLSDRLGVKVEAATRVASEKAVADLIGMVKVAEPGLGEVAGLIEVEAVANLSEYWGLALHKHSLDRYRSDLIARLQRDMVLSTLANETVDEMEDRLKKSLKGMEHRAWLIARMEQSRAYNDSAVESLKSTTILPDDMMKKIHETSDTRNHPFSRASHGITAKPDDPFRVSVAKVMAAGKMMDKPTGGILWKQEGGFFVGMNLPGHFGERGRVVPWREEWGEESGARATAKATRKRHEEKEAALGEKITRKKKAAPVKPKKKAAPVKVKVDPWKVAQAELAQAEKAAVDLGLDPHHYGLTGRNGRTLYVDEMKIAPNEKALKMLEFLARMPKAQAIGELDALDAVAVAYRKAADLAPVAWEKAERRKWLAAMTDKWPRGRVAVQAAVEDAAEFYPVHQLRILAADGAKIKHSASNSRAFVNGAERSVNMDLRRTVGKAPATWGRPTGIEQAHAGKDTLVHELGHVLDAIMGGGRAVGSPWKARPGFEDAPGLWSRAYGKPYDAAKSGGAQKLPNEKGGLMWAGRWAHPYDARIYHQGSTSAAALAKPHVGGPIEFIAQANGRRAGAVSRRLVAAGDDVRPMDWAGWRADMRKAGLNPDSGRDEALLGAPKLKKKGPQSVSAKLANTIEAGDTPSARARIYGTAHRDALEELYGDGHRFARSLAEQDLDWAGDGDVHATALFIRQQHGTPLEKLLGKDGALAGKLSKPWDGRDWAMDLVPEHAPPAVEQANWTTLVGQMVGEGKDIR